MKLLIKIVVVLLVLLVVGVLGAYGYVESTYSFDHPDTALPKIEASKDPAVIAQGEYIANAVAHCSTCHAPFTNFSDFKLDPATPLSGGYKFETGPFGTYTAANLTSHDTGLGKLSDGQIARAIRHGVGANGKIAIMMRFAVGPMSDEDLTAVVSYLRTQPAVEAKRDQAVYGIIAKFMSGKVTPKAEQAPPYVASGTTSVDRGRYLAIGPANCSGCHTRFDFETFGLAGPIMAGADAEPDGVDPTMEIAAPNLTPDPKTGHITSWTEEIFVQRFKSGRTVKGSKMPWEAFALMKEEDAKSIYRYLRTLPPTEHVVGPPHRKAGWKPE